jgi:thiol-disulfide isomerase/thioredoxin
VRQGRSIAGLAASPSARSIAFGSQYRFTRCVATLAALAFVLLAGCPGKPGPKPKAKPKAVVKVGSPDFTLTALDGSTVTLSSLKGKPVVIDFWGTWCGPCRKAVPELVKLYGEFSPKGVTFLGIALNDPRDSLVKFQKDNSIPYPILLGTNDVAKAYQVTGIPMTVLLDKEGQIVYHGVGFEPDSGLKALERALNKVTGGKGVSR